MSVSQHLAPAALAFTDKQIELLQTFADQAVIAIENVRLFKELEARNRDLTESLEQQTATAEILRVISSSPTDVQPVFDTIVRSALRLCNGATSAVFRVEGGMLHHPANYGGSPEALAAARARYPRPVGRDSVPGLAVLTRSEYEVPDTEDPSAIEMSRDTGRILGIRSLFAVPMLRDGQAVGAIVVTRREPGRFAAPEMSLLKTFADQAVIAIENVRLFTELQQKNRALTHAHAQITEALEQQTATSEILRVISRSQTDVQPVFDTIVRNAVRLCDGLFSALLQFDGELIHLGRSPQLHPRSPRGAAPRSSRRAQRRDLWLGRAILERAVVHIPDVEADPEYQHQALSRAIGSRSGLFVPMLREGAPIGVIVVARAEPGPFSDSEIELLKTFADQAVIAIENVRLFKELQARTGELTRSVEQLTALGEVSRAVSSTLDLETVLDTIVSRASQLAGAAGCVDLRVRRRRRAVRAARHPQLRRGRSSRRSGRRRSGRAKGSWGARPRCASRSRSPTSPRPGPTRAASGTRSSGSGTGRSSPCRCSARTRSSAACPSTGRRPASSRRRSSTS